ncbi:MAG: glycosyl hydrolase family 18 protein, partial [bacterium]
MKSCKQKTISIFLLIILILPVLVTSVIPFVLTEKVQAEEPEQTSWLNNISNVFNDDDNSWIKGILMLLISFIINRFINEDTADEPDHIIGDEPAVDDSSQQQREVLGFYVNWVTQSASSYEALKNNWRNIDMVAPFWYTLNPDGNIESRYGGHQYEVDSFTSDRDIEILPLINNNQQNNMILVDPEIREKAIDNVIKLIEKHNYDGVNIDFEFLPTWTRQGYTAFVKNLYQKLQKINKTMTISVFP